MMTHPYDKLTAFRHQPQMEQDCVENTLRVFSQLTTYRNQGFAGQWEEVAKLVLPSFSNTFTFGNANSAGEKKTHHQIDATGQLALGRFGAVCESMLTPRNSIYQHLKASDPYVMKDRETKLWFEEATRRLFYYRNMPEANFSSQNQANFLSLGAFGNHAMFIDELDDYEVSGLRYRSVPLGEIFWRENHQGRIDSFVRWFKLTARQAEQKWPGQLPPNLRTALIANSEQQFNFLHFVEPRDDYDHERMDARGKRWRSVYVSMEGRCLMYKQGMDCEGGYRTFPIAPGRYEQAPGEVYGRGWAMSVLPALKTLNAQKAVFLKQGHQAADPTLITGDDGVIGSRRPGSVNPGLVNSDGKPMVHALPSGDIQISKEMMGEERSLINDAALVTLFQILTKQPQMSATEVIERAHEKGILLAPTMGRQQSEYIGPMTDRELDILAYKRLLPPMPPRLQEAKGSYNIVYDNPLTRLANAQESAGFMRTVESVKEMVAVSGDPSLLDPFEFPVAIPAMAERNAVPASWMSSEKSMQQKAKARAQAMKQEAQIKALPGQAAIMNAQAKSAKAGAVEQQPGEQAV